MKHDELRSFSSEDLSKALSDMAAQRKVTMEALCNEDIVVKVERDSCQIS